MTFRKLKNLYKYEGQPHNENFNNKELNEKLINK